MDLQDRLASALNTFRTDFGKEPTEIKINPEFTSFLFPIFFETRNVDFLDAPVPSFRGFPVRVDEDVEYFQIT